MSDLTTRLTEAAWAAIADIMPAIELEVANGCEVKGGTAWIERAVNVNRLLRAGGPR